MNFKLSDSSIFFSVYHNSEQSPFVLVSLESIRAFNHNHFGFIGHSTKAIGQSTRAIRQGRANHPPVGRGFLCGIGALVGLIEGIIYLTKSDEDFVNTYITNKKGWF
jgi:hypothetical protein